MSQILVPEKNAPKKVAVVLFPGFEPLDVFGPLEAFQMLSLDTKFDLFVIAPSMDPVTNDPRPDPATNKTGSKFAFHVLPTHTLDTAPEDLEVLLVPGGIGTRWATSDPVVEYIKKVYPKLKYLITVCNGVEFAARAGVLDGKKATGNKSAWKETIAMGPKVEWVKHARYMVDGNCWTSGGVSAGLDIAFAWIAHVWGREEARSCANRVEYEWKDDRHWDAFAYVFSD